MELNRFTDYALRTLMYLAVAGDRSCTTQEIAQAYSISQHHLAKVVQRLTELELIQTSRGRGGGLRLACAPGHVNLGVTIAYLESTALVECLASESESECVIEGACVLQSALTAAREAFFSQLSRYTLEDLVRPRARLADRLQLVV